MANVSIYISLITMRSKDVQLDLKRCAHCLSIDTEMVHMPCWKKSTH